ncbi:selenide, water dikinase SelD [Orenia metallireducens]|nr:selenide, water dikinase SelD [Orenia metallireducens]
MSDKIKLTQYSKTSGCAAKMSPQTLSKVLNQVDFKSEDERLLVGLDKSDDAIAYQFSDDKILIQSVDFFTPIVDDPYLFGQIATTNALSDIYAMGGRPLLAMNVVGFPPCLGEEVLSEILQGGADKVAEAGAIIAGGHTIQDDEPKYGLSVTGVIEEGKLLTNSAVQVGDYLILTKPLGMGVISTAIKGGLITDMQNHSAVKAMTTLNDKAVAPMQEIGVNACTDVTGFGLLGHLWEMAEGSGVEIEVFASELPIFADALEYAEMGLIPEGAYSNKKHLEEKVEFATEMEQSIVDMLFDPQTSGGLLISVSEDKVADLLIELYALGINDATVIAKVRGHGAKIKVSS